MKYVLGIDYGTGGVRVGIFDISGNQIIFRTTEYELITPKTGYAEQRIDDWWNCLIRSSHNAIKDSGIDVNDIIGIGYDATACTPVFFDENMQPLRNAIMWMDMRGAQQAKRIAASGHHMLKYNGYGNVSPEWFPCKALWVKENEPEIYEKIHCVMDAPDWIGYKLTGNISKNITDGTTRWYYDDTNGGWQKDFYETIGLGDIVDKLPENVLHPGETLGRLTKEAAHDLGLREGTPVAVGAADAYNAMFGLGVVRNNKCAMVTGSSHLYLILTDKTMHAKGMFGSYPNAVIKGLNMIEAGQTSTGSIINWHKKNNCGYLNNEAKQKGVDVYDLLNEGAEKLPIGSDGLICLDYFQGNRTPYSDGEVRGMIGGLSLMHTPIHIYKALVESICYGAEIIFRNFEKEGTKPAEVYACGGAVKSDFWMQTHADISNIPINITKVSEAPVLGSAILSVAGGVYGDVVTASENMVEVIKRIEPNLDRHEQYKYYVNKYMQLYPMLKEWMHDLVRHENA